MELITLNLLAQIELNEFLDKGTVTAQSLSENWDNQWIEILQKNMDNNLYGALTKLGIFFAVGTLLFFMIQWIKDVLYYEYSRPISSLVWPLIIVILLANTGQGSLFSNLTLSLRNFLNSINQQVVTSADTNQVYQQALNMSIAEDVTGSLLRTCQSLTGDKQSQCLVKTSEKIDIFLQEYRNEYGDQPWITRLENRVNQIRFETLLISEIEFNALLGSSGQTLIKTVLISSQTAFQNLIEATMLLIATLGPLALGSSLLPVAGKPIFAWLTGFFALGIAKISFNILAIITANVIVSGPGQNPNTNPDLLWFMIFLGILAPILSLVVATAGGFAVFIAINSTSTWVKEKV